ncbi:MULTISPECIES: poly-gamma-glutamate biosynthesis protein PgsC [Idiomarina]|uniref:poly-gamma-glutamate biosynthesis protein PgsC n=1 Tax=Idiomarina TaxID=135575 RepID=UPI00129C6DFF|nr:MULTISPECIES: poly-gamma-glutamate biosynthesis protein PgsC [Idiomarina]MDX1525678.1 poly-gamma-glutamate biosynthesis protein PgsC [Pseudidiomarina maritima]MRJ41899.1 poly-gamma-glutamate biosynthesis protein PgsC [Idiomarina sp. FeN1]NCU57182.1 poly-gamma-glutamate biosynthesis protein PgsC [Idiomarina sp. FenA--70]NCU59891.1 poly-gamma-glutamate biosynthesis protein PgsC [Idiomarina sp. FenBw--71]UUN12811.1 poly-gamma-glutamate biosynthesis protein PgsC [Idiomarina loihiensis]
MIALNILAVAIGIGLFFALFLSQMLGLAAGGLVVPGYMALQLTNPMSIALTLFAALLTYLIVRTVASFAVIYGRRQTIIMILTGYLIAGLFDVFLANLVTWVDLDMVGSSSGEGEAQVAMLESNLLMSVMETNLIGYIIPGLIAIWFDRQGVLQTLCGLAVTAVLVRLSLIILMPDQLAAYEASQAFQMPGW